MPRPRRQAGRYGVGCGNGGGKVVFAVADAQLFVGKHNREIVGRIGVKAERNEYGKFAKVGYKTGARAAGAVTVQAGKHVLHALGRVWVAAEIVKFARCSLVGGLVLLDMATRKAPKEGVAAFPHKESVALKYRHRCGLFWLVCAFDGVWIS